MKKAWIHKANSFKEAEKFNGEYYFNMNGLERLDIVQFLREEYFKIKRRLKNESRKGLRKSIKIIK